MRSALARSPLMSMPAQTTRAPVRHSLHPPGSWSRRIPPPREPHLRITAPTDIWAYSCSAFFLPSQPIPHLCVKPNDGPPEKDVSSGVPADTHLAAPFHARADRAFGVRNVHTRVEHGRLMQQIGFRADDLHLSAERTRRVTVQLHGGTITQLQQAGVNILDSNVHGGTRSIHDLGERIARLQFPASKGLYMRCRHDAVDRRAQLSAVEQLLCAAEFRLPVIGLHTMNA